MSQITEPHRETAHLDLLTAARAYINAREEHCNAALLRVLDESAPAREPEWLESEVVAPDGIALTVPVDLGDGVVRHQQKMPTCVALERAERNLKQASRDADDSELRDAALDVFLRLCVAVQGRTRAEARKCIDWL